MFWVNGHKWLKYSFHKNIMTPWAISFRPPILHNTNWALLIVNKIQYDVILIINLLYEMFLLISYFYYATYQSLSSLCRMSSNIFSLFFIARFSPKCSWSTYDWRIFPYNECQGHEAALTRPNNIKYGQRNIFMHILGVLGTP